MSKALVLKSKPNYIYLDMHRWAEHKKRNYVKAGQIIEVDVSSCYVGKALILRIGLMSIFVKPLQPHRRNSLIAYAREIQGIYIKG